VNIWQGYKQDHGYLVHFARLANTLLKDGESARDNHVLASNLARVFTDFNFFFTLRLSNKLFLIWSLTTLPHLKCATTLPCNLSLMACFADINVLQGSVATCKDGWDFYYAFYCKFTSEKNCKSVKI